MRAFLIDFENVKSAGLVGIETLGIDDQVVILYSVNSNTISFEMHQKIMSCAANVEYYQIRRGGKNSLDFQLSTLLGYLLASGLYTHLYIVSNDSGFDALYDFWTSQYIPTDCVVYRRPNIAMSVAHSAFNTRSLPQNVPSAEEVEIDVTTDDSGAYAQFEMDSEQTEDLSPIEIEAEEISAEDGDGHPLTEDEKSKLVDDEETAAILAALQAAQLENEELKAAKISVSEPAVHGKVSVNTYDGMSAAARMKQAELEAEEEEMFAPSLFLAPEELPAPQESADEENRPRRRRGRPRRSKPEKESVSQKEEVRRKADPAQVAVISARLESELSDVCSREQRNAVAEEILLAEGKQEFYRGIIRRFGQKKGLVVYKAVKSDFVTLKKK